MSRDWDDLRYFLALAREGSVRSAASSLQVTHSTVSRRITALEEKMATRLFDKTASGYVPTQAGEQMVVYAQRVEENVAEMELAVQGIDEAPCGVVRVTTLEEITLGLAPLFERFRSGHSGITLDIIPGTRRVDLALREADAAIRLTNSPKENLVGRRVANMCIAPYASREYLQSVAPDTPITDLRWISWSDPMLKHPAVQFIENNVSPNNIVLRVSTGVSGHASAVAGSGVAIMNCYVADQDPRLQRVTEPNHDWDLGMWVVTHEDLRATARVRLFLEFMYTALGEQRDLIEGRKPLYPTWSQSV